MPIMHRNEWSLFQWGVTALILLWVLLLWVVSFSTRIWWTQSSLIFATIQLALVLASGQYVLADGVLAVVGPHCIDHRIPLAQAEVMHQRGRMRIRWQERRRWRTVALSGPAAFLAAVEQAIEDARRAEPAPAESAAAGQGPFFAFLVSPGSYRWLIGMVLGWVVLFGLAIWLNQPLFLLPMAANVRIAKEMNDGRLIMLQGESLWVLVPGQQAYPIPLEAVRSVKSYQNTSVIETTDPAYSSIPLNTFASTQMVTKVRRWLKEGHMRVEAGAPRLDPLGKA